MVQIKIYRENLFIFWQYYLLNTICFRPLIMHFSDLHASVWACACVSERDYGSHVHLCALCSPLNLGVVVVVSSVSANLRAIYMFIMFLKLWTLWVIKQCLQKINKILRSLKLCWWLHILSKSQSVKIKRMNVFSLGLTLL